ncbi:hypothetical protein D3C77_560180 [compost metagenome]
MRANTVGGNFTAVAQPLTLKAVDTEYTTTGVGGVVLGGIQPFTALVDHRMPIEVPVRLRSDGLQQTTITQIDQVALGAWTAGHEQGDRLFGMIDDVMTALGYFGGKYLSAVQAVTDGIVLAITVVTR